MNRQTVLSLVQIEDRQDLAIERYESLPDHFATENEFLDHLQRRAHDLNVPGVQGI